MCNTSYITLNCINKILESKTYMFLLNTDFTWKWKHIAFLFLWLIFAKWNTLQAHLYCCIWQNFIHFDGWVVFVYIYTPHLVYPLMCDVHLRLLVYLGYCKKVCTFLSTQWASCLNITELRFLSASKLFPPSHNWLSRCKAKGWRGRRDREVSTMRSGASEPKETGLWGNGGLHEHAPLGESAF